MDAIVELDLTDVAFGGDAIGRLDGEVAFVSFGLPGERVRAAVYRRKRDYASARVVEVLRAAPERTIAPCAYFGTCGGCQWQHASYTAQLAMRQRVVVDQIRRIGGFADAEDLVRPTIGMVDPWQYRNHVRFSVGRKYGDVGFTYRESHRLLPIEQCLIAHPAVNTVLHAIQRRCAGLRAHQITVRYGCNTGDLLVNPALPMVPEVETGQAALTEEILDRRYRISGPAFFQVNTKRERRTIPSHLAAEWTGAREAHASMADLLALTVLARLEPEREQLVLDAFCGVGTFAALIAPRVREVIAVEESVAAVKDARHNTAELQNVRFVTAKTEEMLDALEQRVDAVVLDPARSGCSPRVIRSLIDLRPRRVVYVSCDPATLARDLRQLREGGFRVEQVEPLDLFPHTAHVETVTTLTWPG
ncbi:MAG: methyltransferase domain-containing protein [Chloroflexi bacterium]|nr:methyltransferase domain-containing protein [Chloroflexota bacterium]